MLNIEPTTPTLGSIVEIMAEGTIKAEVGPHFKPLTSNRGVIAIVSESQEHLNAF